MIDDINEWAKENPVKYTLTQAVLFFAGFLICWVCGL